jgi:hypothetical protein
VNRVSDGEAPGTLPPTRTPNRPGAIQASINSFQSPKRSSLPNVEDNLPLSAAERAAPGTELPVKASEETRKLLSALTARKMSGDNLSAITTEPVIMPFHPATDDTLIIDEEDKRLSDLRESGKSISHWEATWANPRPSQLKLQQQRLKESPEPSSTRIASTPL